jgi:hypothetical protein
LLEGCWLFCLVLFLQKKDEDKKKRRELQASLEEKCKKSLGLYVSSGVF